MGCPYRRYLQCNEAPPLPPSVQQLVREMQLSHCSAVKWILRGKRSERDSVGIPAEQQHHAGGSISLSLPWHRCVSSVSVGRPLRVALQAAPVSSARGCCAPAPEPLSRRGAGCNGCQHAVLTRPLGSGFSWSLQCSVICKSCRDH